MLDPEPAQPTRPSGVPRVMAVPPHVVAVPPHVVAMARPWAARVVSMVRVVPVAHDVMLLRVLPGLRPGRSRLEHEHADDAGETEENHARRHGNRGRRLGQQSGHRARQASRTGRRLTHLE
jgi:hypothetical protein